MLNEVLAVGITGAGCPGAKGIVDSLKGFEIVGFDSNVDNVAIAPYLARLHNVLPGSDSNYIVDLLPKLEDVDVLLPCTSDELLPLALAVEHRLIPCPVAVSSSKAIRIANNKFKLSKMFANHAPATILANGNNVISMAKTLGYPEKKVIVKPVEGSGSRGLMILKIGRAHV